MVRPIIINRELIDGRTIWKGQRVVTYQTSINPPGIPMPGMQQPNDAGKMVSSDYDHFDPTMVGLVAALDRLIFYHDILVRDNDADQASFKAGIQTLLIWGDGTPVYDERMEGTWDEAVAFLDGLRVIAMRSQRGDDVMPNSVNVVIEAFAEGANMMGQALPDPSIPLQRIGLKWGKYDARVVE